MLGIFRNLWLYRNFVFSSVRNDLINRFARSKLGGLWMIINPLAQVAIYALILSNILAAKLPDLDNKYSYAIYLMAGLLAWNLFSEIISRCLNLFIEQASLIKKMQFPRITLPTIVVGSCLLNNILLLIAMLGIFILLNNQFSLAMFWLLPLVLMLTSFAVGIGLILGILNVFIRDIGQVIPIVLQIWFWLTPIVYPITVIPQQYRHWLGYNPMCSFTTAYQDILVYGKSPQITELIFVGLFGVLLLIFSLFLFRRANEDMADLL